MNQTGHKEFPINVSIVLTFVILGLTFSIMMIGVYLSSTHQGFSCKTWPLCPNGFNFPPEEYFVEHFHRSLVLILSVILFIFAGISYRVSNLLEIRSKLILAVVLLVAQIIIGWVMIETKLNPIIVATHLAIALSFFAVILLILISTIFIYKKNHAIRQK